MRRVVAVISIAVWGLIGVSPVSALPLGFSTQAFTGDADSGISRSLTYTHAINFQLPGGPMSPVSINGVIFQAGGNGDHLLSLGYNLQNASNTYANMLPSASDHINLTGAVHALDKDSFYGGGAASEVLTLSGLQAGKTYETTFYSIGSGAAGSRYSNVSDGVNQFLYDQNWAGKGNGSLLIDVFVATGPTATFTWTVAPGFSSSSSPRILSSASFLGAPNTTAPSVAFEQFAFSNAEISNAPPVPEPSSLLLLAVGGIGLWFTGRRRSRR